MSHFSVAVLSHCPEEVDELLAPFCECTDDPAYLEIVPADTPMEEMRQMYAKEKKGDEPFDTFVNRYYGCSYNEELDECGYLCNPNAKWDWYQVGGRWSNTLRLKPRCHGNHGEKSWCNENEAPKEGLCDQARLCDVDLSPDPSAYERAVRFWEVVVEGAALRADEAADQYQTFYSREYYLDQFGDKHSYAQHIASFSAWAFLTPDGEWHQNGQMGWWGVHDATKESRNTFALALKAALDSDSALWLTIVDCHI